MIMIMADYGWCILHDNWHWSSVMYMTIHYLWFRNETPNVEKNHAAWPTKATCLHQDLPSFSSHHRLGNIQWIQHDHPGGFYIFPFSASNSQSFEVPKFCWSISHWKKTKSHLSPVDMGKGLSQSCFHPSRGGGPPRFPTWTGLFRSRTSK